MAENRPRHGKQIFKCLEHTLRSSQNKFQQKNGKQIFVDFFQNRKNKNFRKIVKKNKNLSNSKWPKTDPDTVNKFSNV